MIGYRSVPWRSVYPCVKLNKTYQISRPAKAPIAVGSDVIVVKLRDDKAGFQNLWLINITHTVWVIPWWVFRVNLKRKTKKVNFSKTCKIPTEYQRKWRSFWTERRIKIFFKNQVSHHYESPVWVITFLEKGVKNGKKWLANTVLSLIWHRQVFWLADVLERNLIG